MTSTRRDERTPLVGHPTSVNYDAYASPTAALQEGGIPRRYIMVLLSFLGLVLCYSYRVILSVAIIPMNEEYGYSDQVKGLVLSSFFWGYLCTQMPAGFLCSRFGGKAVLGFGVALSGFFTILTPFAAPKLPLLVACRVVTGIVEGVAYPTIHSLLANWSHENERSRFVTLVWSGAYVGTVVSMLVSPILIKALGWPSVFFIFGAPGLLWGVLWYFLAASTPAEHKHITAQEIIYLSGSQTAHKAVALSDILMLLRSPHSWAIIANHFGNNWGFYILLTWLPTYLNKELNFNMSNSSFLSVLPFVTMFTTTIIGGQLADLLLKSGVRQSAAVIYGEGSDREIKQQSIRKTVVRKIFGAGGLSIAAASFVLINYVKNPYFAIGCVVAALGGSGLASSGFGVNHIDIAPRHAGILMGMSNTAATIPGIVGVYLVGYMSWPEVFLVAAGIYGGAVLVWLLFSTGRRVFE